MKINLFRELTILGLIVLSFYGNRSYSQDTLGNNADYFIQDKLESIAEQTDNYIDYSTMIDHLNNYKDHPINLNFASREQLQEFGLLNEVQITSLLNHIKQFGKLI